MCQDENSVYIPIKKWLITETSNSTDDIKTNRTTITRKQKQKENQFYIYLKDKLGKSQTWKPEHGAESETWRKKINLFLEQHKTTP